MKFPSLFRTPKPQRFRIEPRYYDPIKEDIEERTEKIKRQLSGGQEFDFKSNISGVFSRRRTENRQSNFLQIGLVALFFGIAVGYLFYGNNIFYLLLIFIPVYLYLKLKRSS